MDKEGLLESNCVKFIEALQKVEAKSFEYHALFSKVYATSYNGCFKVRDFIRELNHLYKGFKYELQHLPLNHPSDNSRKIFLINLYGNLLEIRSDVEERFKTDVQLRFRYMYLGKNVILKKFPEQFCGLLYESKRDYENHKVHFMYHVQYRTINKAIDLVNIFAINEGTDLARRVNEQGNDDEKTAQDKAHGRNRRIKTPLTLAQVSFFINLASEVVTGGAVPKSELAEFISGKFETSRSREPSKRQVYKAFYEVDDSTREVVKDLVIEMLNRVRD